MILHGSSPTVERPGHPYVMPALRGQEPAAGTVHREGLASPSSCVPTEAHSLQSLAIRVVQVLE